MSEEAEVQETEATTAPAEDAPSFEDRALTMGWVPKEQFKGDPEKWVEAETFVKRGEEFLPFLKANNRRLEQALEKANERIDGLNKAVKDSIGHISRAEKAAYDRARKDLEADLEKAAEAGDTAGVKAVTKELVDLEKEVAAKADKPEADDDVTKAREDWLADNPWFNTDRAMAALAREISGELAADPSGKWKDPRKELAEVTRRIKLEFPDKFENPNRRTPSPVEGGGRPRTAGKTYADMPKEARDMCDDFCRNIKGFKKEQYVKDYFAQESAR